MNPDTIVSKVIDGKVGEAAERLGILLASQPSYKEAAELRQRLAIIHTEQMLVARPELEEYTYERIPILLDLLEGYILVAQFKECNEA